MYANGSQYAGTWLDDKRHGHGIFEANGYVTNLLTKWTETDVYYRTRYEGEWVEGRKEGKGAMYLPTGDILTGIWKNGVNVSGVYTFRADSPWANPDF